tara:strand:+ start:383 stop:589 length:207 start_codon:yes stop_codon:yes gene_type:complete
MKLLLFLPITFCFLFPTKSQASRTYQISYVCESFAAGKIDAIETLKVLDLNVDDYTIGINNTAKIFCA